MLSIRSAKSGLTAGVLLLSAFALTGCMVPKSDLEDAQAQNAQLQTQNQQLQTQNQQLHDPGRRRARADLPPAGGDQVHGQQRPAVPVRQLQDERRGAADHRPSRLAAGAVPGASSGRGRLHRQPARRRAAAQPGHRFERGPVPEAGRRRHGVSGLPGRQAGHGVGEGLWRHQSGRLQRHRAGPRANRRVELHLADTGCPTSY